MNYYLRIEGVNLGDFIYDTNNLQVIRGGSLLLLHATTEIENLVQNYLSKLIDIKIKGLEKELESVVQKQINDKALKNKRKNIKVKIKKNKAKRLNVKNSINTITNGASWGLYDIKNIDCKDAILIKQEVMDFFNKDSNYKHATIMVDIYKCTHDKSYVLDRSKLQTLNHYQQLQTPSIAITKNMMTASPCVLDKVRPATKKIKMNNKNVSISDSVFQRKEYGGNKKKSDFYYSITDFNLNFTQDLSTLSCSTKQTNLNGKIAFIYIDGNEFGKKQRSSKTAKDQRDFDQITRKFRNNTLKEILFMIKGKEDWIFIDDNNKKLQLETLLWGGDEIIWVVPAWQGWWMLDQFYQLSQGLTFNNKPLFHGSALIFCKHNAPIHRIDQLARKLADDFAKRDKTSNHIAYQVLESFDHAGNKLSSEQEARIQGLASDTSELLIKAEDMNKIEKCIKALKDYDFPKRKIYQIVNHYRNDNSEKAEELYDKLIGKHLSKYTFSEEQQTCYKDQLTALNTTFKSKIYWLHLMELWDYVALDGEKT